MRIIFFLFIIVGLFGCGRKHFNRKHPWQPKRVKYLDNRYEKCDRN